MKGGIRSKKHDANQGEFELHYIGAMGEWAVHLRTGADLDKSLCVGDDGIDLRVGEYDCHVKTRTYTGRPAEFFVDDLESFSAPVGIGVQILSPVRARILGCISKARFAKLALEKDYGYGPRLVVPESCLASVDVLLKV